MTPSESLTASAPVVWLCSAVLLLLMYGCGRLLVPANMGGHAKLPLLAFRLGSGMVFLTGIGALAVLGRMSYIGFMPLLQIAVASYFQWRARQQVAMPASSAPADAWTRAEWLALAVITAVATWLFQLPCECALSDGRLREIHEDLGYFIQLVIALPESGAANGWASVLAEQSAAAGVRDIWYHWGAIFLAAVVRGVTGMPAISALLGVVGSVMNVTLVIAAGGVMGLLCKMSVRGQLVAGCASVACVQVLKSPALYGFLAAVLPYDTFHLARVPLGLVFPYKYEGVLALSALGAWLCGRNVAAVLMLFLASCSAPHTVAAAGVACAPLIVIGLVRRDARCWRTGVLATATVLCAWALVSLAFGAGIPKGEGQSLFAINLGEITQALRFGTVDSLVAFSVGIISLIGVLHLVRVPDTEDENAARIRLLGWMALGGVVGSSIALQMLHRMADRFHVVVLVHSLLVLPAGMWGLVRMMNTRRDWTRHTALALAVASLLMGVHDILLPVVKNKTTVWTQADVSAIKDELRGRPVGYFAKGDRGWWIPKNSLLGGLLESRIMRLNPLDESGSAHSRFYGSQAPFRLLPPGKDEPVYAWSLRYAEKIGVRHVIETWEDRLPKSVRARARPIVSAAGLMLYELPPPDDRPAPEAGVAQSAP